MLKKRLRCGTITLVTLASGFLASAQTPEVLRLYDAYANVPTEISGVKTFKEPPSSFNPINATDEQLAMYGFPPRPDKTTNPQRYETWAREMSRAKIRWNGPLKYTNHRIHLSQPQEQPENVQRSELSVQPDISVNQRSLTNLTWSGVVNYKPIKKFSTAATSAASFSYVATAINVPVANFPNGFAGLCGYSGNVWLFVGIDGAPLPVAGNTLSGDLLAAGVFGYVDNYSPPFGGCPVDGPYTAVEIAWFGTTPYTIEEFTVNPGDEIEIQIFLTSATTANVYVSDNTQGVYGTYQLQSSFPVLGSTAEYIAARLDQGGPLGAAPYLWNLNNFTGAFLAGTGALDYYNKFYGPGTNTTNTFAFSMTDDAGDQIISQAHAFPQAISTTNYGDAMYIYTENCAANVPQCTYTTSNVAPQ